MLSYVSFSLPLSLTFNGEETKLSSITKTAVPSIRIHSFLLNVFYLLTWLTTWSSSRLFFCKVSSRYPLLSLGLISWKKKNSVCFSGKMTFSFSGERKFCLFCFGLNVLLRIKSVMIEVGNESLVLFVSCSV